MANDTEEAKKTKNTVWWIIGIVAVVFLVIFIIGLFAADDAVENDLFDDIEAPGIIEQNNADNQQ